MDEECTTKRMLSTYAAHCNTRRDVSSPCFVYFSIHVTSIDVVLSEREKATLRRKLLSLSLSRGQRRGGRRSGDVRTNIYSYGGMRARSADKKDPTVPLASTPVPTLLPLPAWPLEINLSDIDSAREPDHRRASSLVVSPLFPSLFLQSATEGFILEPF